MRFPGECFGVLKCVRCIAGIIEHVEPLVAYSEAVLYTSPVVVMDLAGYQILGAESLKET